MSLWAPGPWTHRPWAQPMGLWPVGGLMAHDWGPWPMGMWARGRVGPWACGPMGLWAVAHPCASGKPETAPPHRQLSPQ